MKRLLKRTWKQALLIAGVIQVARSPLDAYDAYQRYVSLLDDARTALKPAGVVILAFFATATAGPALDPAMELLDARGFGYERGTSQFTRVANATQTNSVKSTAAFDMVLTCGATLTIYCRHY